MARRDEGPRGILRAHPGPPVNRLPQGKTDPEKRRHLQVGIPSEYHYVTAFIHTIHRQRPDFGQTVTSFSGRAGAGDLHNIPALATDPLNSFDRGACMVERA